ncbi:hypothetical protein HDU76_013608, partial [Blyttiomyces sp. JEL0837]
MCTYSSNKNELWASIVEKAYMKLMGGYDFPGSNRSAWPGYDSELHWNRFLRAHIRGDALITIATLKPFPVLNLKNPWNHKRWKGSFSHLDEQNWTEDLKKELDYDHLSALQYDDGKNYIETSLTKVMKAYSGLISIRFVATLILFMST